MNLFRRLDLDRLPTSCRHLGSLLVLLVAAAFPWSDARAISGCTLGSPNQVAAPGPGGTANFTFSIDDLSGCTGANGTIAITSNTTGGGTISTPTFSGGLNAIIPFSMTVGTTPGTMEVTVTCASGCSGSTTLIFQASAHTYQLLPASPTLVRVQPNTPTTIQARALRNGAPLAGVPLNYDLTGPMGAILTPSIPVTDGTGVATAQFQAPTVGSYSLDGSYCAPDLTAGSGCVAYFTGFTVLVGTSLNPAMGNPLGGNANQTLPPVKVVAIDGGLPAANIPITWAIQSGSATLGATQPTTDGAGEAGAQVTLGNAPGTSVIVRATRTDTNEFADIVLAINSNYTLTAVTAQTLTVGVNQQVPITARYLLNGAPNPNPVGFSVAPAGPTLLPTSITPDGNGDATTQFTSGAVGTYTVTASGGCPTMVPNCPPTPVDFTVNVVAQSITVAGPAEVNPGEPVTLSATVLDNGVPAVGVTVNWTLAAGSALPASGSSITNGAGIATLPVTIGNAVPSTVTYSAARGDAPSVTNSWAMAVVAPTLARISGDNQTGLTGTTTAVPMVVELRDGKTGNAPLAGKTINWSTLSGPAFPQAGSTITDASGRASVFANYGASGGPSVIQAIEAGPAMPSVTFALTSELPTLVGVSGNNQVGAPGATLAPLVVRAENNGSPTTGVLINWTVVSGSATINTNTTLTDNAGQAQVVPTLPVNGGTSQIRAVRADAPGVQFLFTISSNGLLAVQSGDGQLGPPNTPGAQPLVARLTAGVTPIPGATVNWVVVSGAGSVGLNGTSSVTDANGDASITFTHGALPGNAIVRASAFGGTTFADFSVDTAAPELIVLSGDGQSGVPGELLGESLRVRAQTGGTADAGVTVSWSLSGGGSLSQATTVTDANGEAEVTLTLGPAIGPVQVTATRTDSGSSATFTANAGADLLRVSGNNQSGALNSIADAPLVVALVTASSAGVPDQVISWRVLSGAAVLAAPTSTTDATGSASITFRYGASAGPLRLEASAFGGAVTTVFDAVATAGTLQVVGSATQSGPVGAVLPQPFRLRLVESAGAASAKGRGGIPVTWTVASGGGAIVQQTSTTDTNGEAAATLRLGPDRGPNRLVATVAGHGSIEFVGTGIITNAQMVRVSGDNQSLPTNTDSEPLLVRVVDGANRGVGNVTVHWTSTNALRSADTCTTNANGECSIRVRVDLPGAASATARTSDPEAGPVTFTLNGAVAELDNLNPRQAAIAGAIDNSCPALAALGSGRTAAQNDLFARCREIVDAAGIDPDAASRALEALFPDVALVQSTASLLAAQAQQDNLRTRMTTLRTGQQPNALAGLSLTGPGGRLAFGDLLGYLLGADEGNPDEIGAGFSRWGFFASGQLGRAEADASSRNPAYDLDINGLTVGVDYRKSDRLVLGAAIGYTRQDAELAGDVGTLDTQGYSVSGYASWYYGSNWYLDGVLTWGNNSNDLERRIRYTLPRAGGGTTTVDQVARSSSDGDMLSVSATVGRDFQHEAWSYGPYGRFTYSRFGFDETVEQLQSETGSGLGLILDTRDVTSMVGVLGGRVSYTHSAAFGILMPNLTLEWEHEFKDDPAVLAARFINDPTATPIFVEGQPYDGDFLRLGLGLSMVFTGGKSGFVQYERSLGRSGLDEDRLNLGLRIEF